MLAARPSMGLLSTTLASMLRIMARTNRSGSRRWPPVDWTGAVGSSPCRASGSIRIARTTCDRSPFVDVNTWLMSEMYWGLGLLVTRCSIRRSEMNGAVLG